MNSYCMREDISFVSDHDKLVVLNFESGEYFTVEGICMKILQSIGQDIVSKSDLLQILENVYDSDEFDISQSLDSAIKALMEYGFIIEVKKDET